MANPEREIKDMDKKISDLCDVISDTENVLGLHLVNKMRAVVTEWECTKECIQELAAQVEA